MWYSLCTPVLLTDWQLELNHFSVLWCLRTERRSLIQRGPTIVIYSGVNIKNIIVNIIIIIIIVIVNIIRITNIIRIKIKILWGVPCRLPRRCRSAGSCLPGRSGQSETASQHRWFWIIIIMAIMVWHSYLRLGVTRFILRKFLTLLNVYDSSLVQSTLGIQNIF